MDLVLRNRYRDPFGLARNLLTWDPYKAVERRSKDVANGGFLARFEVKETDEAFELTADLPGVSEDDLEITLDGDTLTISGSRAAEEKKETETYYVYERQFGSFSRAFRLPEHANGEAITADLKDGVLKVTVGKKPEAAPRKIKIG